MTPTLREASQRGAEELENCADLMTNFEAPADSCIGKTITSANAAAKALRAAIANEPQAEQPEAANDDKGSALLGMHRHWRLTKGSRDLAAAAMKAEQPGAVGLSDAEIVRLWNTELDRHNLTRDTIIATVRAALATQPAAPGWRLVRMETLAEARNTAMEWTVRGRVPECGAFGEIAQDLDAILADARPPAATQGAKTP